MIIFMVTMQLVLRMGVEIKRAIEMLIFKRDNILQHLYIMPN